MPQPTTRWSKPQSLQEEQVSLDTTLGPYTRQIAQFVDQLSFEELPSEVIEKPKGTLLDYPGAALVGSTRPHAREALAITLALGGSEEATILGSRHRTAVDRAAFLNGLCGSSTPQLDDVWKESLGHPGVGTQPAVLAVGEREKASGADALVAIVAGYELAMRVGAAIGKEAHERGWHPRGGCNVFAAAVASAKLLGLEGLDAYCAVLGLAGNKASGLMPAVFWHDAWYTLSGNASQDGVMAALLAQAGYDAGCTILEDEYGGYCRVVCDHPDWDRLMEGLGERFEIMHIGQKPHASSGATHAAIDATLSIVNQHDIGPEDVERIRIWGFEVMVVRLGHPHPENHVHATMSIPYMVAVALTDGQVLLPQFEEKRLRDPQIEALQERMELLVDPELERMCPKYLPARVEISTKDGAVYTEEVKVPKGDPENPLAPEEPRFKFDGLAGKVLNEDAIEETVQIVDALEEVEDIGDLTAVLRRVKQVSPVGERD
jgi:2-methylcitrate dehydratase PrpD